MCAEIRPNSRSAASRPFAKMSGYVETEFPNRMVETDIHTQNMLSMEGYVETDHEQGVDDELAGSD